MFSRSPAVPVVLAIDLAESAMGAVRPFLERKNLPVHALAAGEAFAWERVRAVLTGSIEGVRRARSAGSGFSVVFIAQTGSEELAIAAFRAGATDYFREPVDLEDLARSLRGNLPAPSTGGDSMIGASAAMRSIREYIVKAAAAESNVLITGETGTGKELVAEMIHNKSSRAHRPLVCVNCAAIPDGLLESELFGYERGAFTGAQTSNAGKLEAANGGTVFFDEIGEMTPYAQTKLLRVTEGREVHRLGGRKPVHLNVRIIAATNRDLDTLAMEDKFRKDLYFRLNVGRIHLPPLRERKSDIPALVDHYMREFNQRFSARVTRIGNDVFEHLIEYAWPGNIRELKNVLESVFVSQPAARITLADLPDWFRKRSEPACPPHRTEPQSECERLLDALRDSHWNKSAAAEKLNWSRMTLYRKLAKYHIAGTEA